MLCIHVFKDNLISEISKGQKETEAELTPEILCKLLNDEKCLIVAYVLYVLGLADGYVRNKT